MLKKLKNYVSIKNRERKFKLAMMYINEGDNIIDIGVDPTISGSTNYFEKWFSGTNKLTCLGVYNDYSKFLDAFPNVELIQFDGMDFSKLNSIYDFAISNAVIEHVGDYEKQLKWLKEISKITKMLFITTPNRFCPIDAHTSTLFFHWFPDSIRNYFYRRLNLEWATKDYMWLLSGWKFKKLLKEANFDVIKIQKNKILCFTLDYVIVAKSKNYVNK